MRTGFIKLFLLSLIGTLALACNDDDDSAYALDQTQQFDGKEAKIDGEQLL